MGSYVGLAFQVHPALFSLIYYENKQTSGVGLVVNSLNLSWGCAWGCPSAFSRISLGTSAPLKCQGLARNRFIPSGLTVLSTCLSRNVVSFSGVKYLRRRLKDNTTHKPLAHSTTLIKTPLGKKTSVIIPSGLATLKLSLCRKTRK